MAIFGHRYRARPGRSTRRLAVCTEAYSVKREIRFASHFSHAGTLALLKSGTSVYCGPKGWLGLGTMDRGERAEHYRHKAEEVRTIAESMNGAEPKEMLMGVAADYLMLAQMLERTQVVDPLPASD